MTREELKKRLPVIQAWCDGKVIEYRALKYETRLWVTADNLSAEILFHDEYQIRIKPELREFWVPLDSKGNPAESCLCHPPLYGGFIHVREVMP